MSRIAPRDIVRDRLQHVFTQVVPLPLPHNHPERARRCFWASRPIRYETQADLLRLLELAVRHFTKHAATTWCP